MELERFRKLTQNEVRKMYDKALEDRYKVKQMEKQMDEVIPKTFISKSTSFIFRKKTKNFVFTLKRRRKSLDYDVKKKFKLISKFTNSFFD
jgi:hypothetical protein